MKEQELTHQQMRDLMDSGAGSVLLRPEAAEEYQQKLQDVYDFNREQSGLPPAPRPKPGEAPTDRSAIRLARAKAVLEAQAKLDKRPAVGGPSKKSSGVDIPAEKKNDIVPVTPPFNPMDDEYRAIQGQSKAMANRKRLEDDKGDRESELANLKAQEAAAKHKLVTDFSKDYKERKDTFLKEYAQLRDEERYPNLNPEQIRNYKSILAKEPEKNWSEEERQTLQTLKAQAQRRLDDGKKFYSEGPYRSLASKFIAAIAVGTGSWAAVRTGRNPALELFQNAIKNDIIAQREEAARRTKRVGARVNAFDRINNIYKDELQTVLTLTGLHYGKAADLVKEKIEKVNSRAESQKLLGMYHELRRQEAAYLKKAQREHALANAGIDIGVKGIKWVGPPGMKPDIKELRVIKDNASLYHQYIRKLNELKGYSGKYLWPKSEELSKALAAWEAVISLAGALHDKGVLQEFEREKLEAVLPEPGTLKEKATGQLGAAVSQLKVEVEHDYRGYMEPRTHYKVSEEAFRVGELGRPSD
jgi:hypothetical protein